MPLRHIRSAIFAAVMGLLLAQSARVPAQEPSRMNAKQYGFFLDQLDSQMPLLKSHFQQLCQTPAWRRESSDLRSVGDQVFASCRELSSKMLSYLAEAVAGEREHARLSVEFKMQFTLWQLIDNTKAWNSTRPYYDPRSEDANFIVKSVSPLAGTLYSHVYASIDDACGSAHNP